MKNLVFIVALFTSFQISGQVTLGLKAGVLRSWEDYGDALVPQGADIHVNRWGVGLLANVPLTGNWKLGFSPGYVQRGAACMPGFIIFAGDSKLLLNYIELPISISYTIHMISDKLDIRPKLGYSVSYLLNAFRVSEVSDNGIISMERTPVEKDGFLPLNDLDHGITGGVEFGYKLPDGRIFLESSYYHSFVDAATRLTSKNRSLRLDIGYEFKL